MSDTTRRITRIAVTRPCPHGDGTDRLMEHRERCIWLDDQEGWLMVVSLDSPKGDDR